MLLLDTHSFVWLAADSARISAPAKKALRAAAGRLFLSTASAWEIGILWKRKRLVLPLDPSAFVARAVEHHGISEIAIDRSVALTATSLPDLHRDPIDRILIATAMEHRLGIVTRDRVIPTYPGIQTIW